MRKRGVGHTGTMRDVSNAFPSPKHGSIDQMVDWRRREEGRREGEWWEEEEEGMVRSRRGADEKARKDIVKLRYKESRVMIKQKDGRIVVVRPGTGGLQEDAPMAKMFSEMYEEEIEKWLVDRKEKGIGIEASDPEGQRWVEVGVTILWEK